MTEPLSFPRHVKVDMVMQSMSPYMSLVAALDAIELSQDKELELAHSKL